RGRRSCPRRSVSAAAWGSGPPRSPGRPSSLRAPRRPRARPGSTLRALAPTHRAWTSSPSLSEQPPAPLGALTLVLERASDVGPGLVSIAGHAAVRHLDQRLLRRLDVDLRVLSDHHDAALGKRPGRDGRMGRTDPALGGGVLLP